MNYMAVNPVALTPAGRPDLTSTAIWFEQSALPTLKGGRPEQTRGTRCLHTDVGITTQPRAPFSLPGDNYPPRKSALSRRATRRLQGKRSSVGDLYQPEPFRYHQGVIIYREFRVAHLGAHFGTVPEPFMSGSPLLH